VGKILVTGGAGYIGSHVVHALLDSGEEPVVVDTLVTGNRFSVPDTVVFEKLDVGDEARIGALIRDAGVDAVMHFAASTVVPESVSDPLKYYINNTANTARLWRACRDNGVKSVVFSSTAATYGEVGLEPVTERHPTQPVSPYGWSKLMSEQALRDLSATGALSAVIMRYFNVAGADPELRRRLEARDRDARQRGDPGWLHRRLAERDPERARELHPNDVVRLVRALEIFERAGGTATPREDAHAAGCPYRVLHLAVDPGREALNARIEARCEAMIEAGLLNEVRALRRRGYGPELRPLQAIGYRHMHPVVEGLDTLVNAVAEMKRDTRRFARRQGTWLRAVPDLRWHAPEDEAGLVAETERFLAESEDAGWRDAPARGAG